MHIPAKLCGKLAVKSLVCTFIGYAKNRHAYCLVHWPIKQFFELCDIIFNEGGTEKCYEHVILESDTTDMSGSMSGGDPPNSTPTNQPERESEDKIEGLLTPLSPSITPAPNPTPSSTTGCPKCTTHAPTWDDDPCYSVTVTNQCPVS